jgi:hypothetical protein
MKKRKTHPMAKLKEVQYIAQADPQLNQICFCPNTQILQKYGI